MKTVWVLTCLGNAWVCGVYSSEAKAERAMRELEADNEEEGIIASYFVMEEEVQ